MVHNTRAAWWPGSVEGPRPEGGLAAPSCRRAEVGGEAAVRPSEVPPSRRACGLTHVEGWLVAPLAPGELGGGVLAVEGWLFSGIGP